MQINKFTTKSYIDHLLFEPDDIFVKDNGSFRFLVHCDIVRSVEMLLHKLGIKSEYEVFKYKLNTGIKLYNMCLISFARINEEKLKYPDEIRPDGFQLHLEHIDVPKFDLLCQKIRDSQFSFVWERNLNLFIEIGSFEILKKFISKYELEEYIIDVKEQVGISNNDNIIKVVTFKPSVSRKLENIQFKFEEHLKLYETYHRPKYYYMAFAFVWLSPQWFEQIYTNNNRDSALFVTVRELGYTNYFNIIDLISLRMALCPSGHPPNSLKGEIDYSINRELTKFIENNHLDLDQYAFAKNIYPRKIEIDYFINEFKNCFKTFKFEEYVLSPTFGSTIKLLNEIDALNKIKNYCNITFYIDGSGYDQMGLSLFLDLVKYRNVSDITLDTNYMWRHDVAELYLNIERLSIVFVIIKGENTYNFVEDFVSSLKSVRDEITGLLDLWIYGNQINDYSIFYNLRVCRISFDDININSRMLEQLDQFNLLTSINFSESAFENKHHNWALLMKLNGRIEGVQIKEDEGTWQCLFEFVWDEMIKTNSIEFRFDKSSSVHIISFNREDIVLRNKIFKITEQKDKLEIYDAKSNEIIDIYSFINKIKPDDKSDYDFYR